MLLKIISTSVSFKFMEKVIWTSYVLIKLLQAGKMPSANRNKLMTICEYSALKQHYRVYFMCVCVCVGGGGGG